MKLSYRAKITILIFSLVFVALAAVTGFFLRLYRNERLASVYETELANTSAVSGRLENLIFISQLIDPPRVAESKDLVWVAESPCTQPRWTVSNSFEKPLKDLSVTPDTWLRSAEVRTVCSEAASDPVNLRLPRFIPGGPRLHVPTLQVLTRGASGLRIALLSLDGLGASVGGHSLLVSDKEGRIIWSDTGNEALQRLMDAAALKPADIAFLASNRLGTGSPGITRSGADGIVAYASLLDRWSEISLNSERALLEALEFVLTQSLLLVGGFLFTCFLVGRIFAFRLTRPLGELALAAQAIGSGRFGTRVKITETDEISVIKASFNAMAEKIMGLIAETKTKALIESEINLAQQVQKTLFPPPHVRVPNHDLYSSVKMADKCGGDWWGYLNIEVEGKRPLLLLLIGDVTGHGVSSALVTASTQGALAMLSGWIEADREAGSDPRNILRLFNRAVFRSSGGALSMTFFAVVLDRNADKMFAANAGHNFPYLLTAEGGIKSVSMEGDPLGAKGECEYPTILEMPWEPGAQLFLYTDGLIDCYKGDENLFERRHLVKLLKREGRSKGGRLLEKLFEQRTQSVKDLKPMDDVTVVVCSRLED